MIDLPFLRNFGFTFDILHQRQFKVAYTDGNGVLKVETVLSDPFIMRTEQRYPVHQLLACGGVTEMIVVDPLSGTEFHVRSICRDDENYNKKRGVTECLTRMIDLMRATDGVDGFCCPNAVMTVW